MKRTVTFLGMLPGAPVEVESDVWGIGYAYLNYAQVLNHLFIMHNPIEFEPLFVEHVRELKIPVFCTRQWEAWPHSVAFPLHAARSRFPDAPWSWTGSYMFAAAIMQDYERICLGGMAYPGQSMEYVGYLPATYYWIGMARGLGIEVEMIGQTELMQPMRWEPPCYGYEINTAGVVAMQFVYAGYAGAHQLPVQFVKTENLTERNRIVAPQRMQMIEQYEMRKQERSDDDQPDIFLRRDPGEEE